MKKVKCKNLQETYFTAFGTGFTEDFQNDSVEKHDFKNQRNSD